MGGYTDASGVNHGFVRDPSGRVTTFDIRAAGTGAGQGTNGYSASINSANVIAGEYADGSSVYQGYVRTPHGEITTFHVPGAGTGAGQGTVPYGNNSANEIVGSYTDDSGLNHGFLRIP